jgi:predicted HicB family RNase H-like nuclease
VERAGPPDLCESDAQYGSRNKANSQCGRLQEKRGLAPEAFHEAVGDYVETCAKIGKEPQKPYSGRVIFRVDPEVHRKAALTTELSGKSLN